MKSLPIIISYCLVQFLVGYFTDMSWWFFIPITAISVVIAKQTLGLSNKTILWIFFICSLTLWFVYSLIINILNNNQLYTMVGGIFGLPDGFLLVIIQALFGAALSLLTTGVTLQFFENKKKDSPYRKF